MNSPLLYLWAAEIARRFAGLGRWQVLTLAIFSYGVILARGCGLNRVAQAVSGRANASSLERRIQRWLANPRVMMGGLWQAWVGWVVSLWGNAPLLVLVDETKLSDHVAVMMVGVAYHRCAIPLIWRAYQTTDYPEEGQVALLQGLLTQLQQVLPPGHHAVLLADRGLGTSPEWQARLMECGWDYLLRVQGSTRVRLPGEQSSVPARRLVSYGQCWTGRAQVFKKAGWQWKWVYLMWEYGYKEPWCLFSNQPDLNAELYAARFHHEASFRDLKSDGFQWQQSRVWMPDHTERLLLVLACASLWTLTQGTHVVFLYPLSRRRQRLSLFRLGLDTLLERFHSLTKVYLEFFLAPDTPLLKSVVP
jgi:Transposase DDE domain